GRARWNALAPVADDLAGLRASRHHGTDDHDDPRGHLGQAAAQPQPEPDLRFDWRADCRARPSPGALRARQRTDARGASRVLRVWYPYRSRSGARLWCAADLAARRYRTPPGPKHPTDLIGVAHSPAYFIAAAIADRGYGWIHASPEKVADPVIAQLIDKIIVDPNPPPYPARFPHPHGATGTITLKDGRQFAAHVDFPRGSAPRGIEWADVDAKYRRLMPLSKLSPDRVEASLGGGD